jgi:hypothetical protein
MSSSSLRVSESSWQDLASCSWSSATEAASCCLCSRSSYLSLPTVAMGEEDPHPESEPNGTGEDGSSSAVPWAVCMDEEDEEEQTEKEGRTLLWSSRCSQAAPRLRGWRRALAGVTHVEDAAAGGTFTSAKRCMAMLVAAAAAAAAAAVVALGREAPSSRVRGEE